MFEDEHMWDIDISLQEITMYLIGKLNQKLVILTFGQFDHLLILDNLIWTHPTW